MSSPSGDEDSAILPVICDVMLSMGDWPEPRADTAALLERILVREISAIVRRAGSALSGRNRSAIKPEDVLYALRRDAVMTSRVFSFLEVRQVHSSVNGGGDEQKRDGGAGKLLERCRAFSARLDSSPGAQLPPDGDTELAARRARLDWQTRAMSAAQYEAFSAVRARAHAGKWAAWLQRRWPADQPRPNRDAALLLQTVLRQLAALLLDACLLVRGDRGDCGASGALPAASVTPQHVLEAVRRLRMAGGRRSDTLLIK